MPAINFKVTWPDGHCHTYCALSTIVLDHFYEGALYGMQEFVTLSRNALADAAARVCNEIEEAEIAAELEYEKIAAKLRELTDRGIDGPVKVAGLSQWNFSGTGDFSGN